jgi:putative transposase
MSKKRTKYTSAFKTKRVLEVLQNEGTLVQIASKHNVLPQNLQNWKKTFLANAEIAMEPSKALKKYKDELIKAQAQNERLTTLVGKVTVEKELLRCIWFVFYSYSLLRFLLFSLYHFQK